MIEGFLIAAGAVALGQLIAKWRNAPRTQQPKWPIMSGLFLGRLTARLIGRQNGGQRGGDRRSLTQQRRYITRA
jgi:hypothetical protein